MSTNHIKWNDTDNRLTAYCDDDSGETEIGPAKWDDTNNKLEINCDSTDFQAKWNDATNKLEAQGVDSECCLSLDDCCGEASIDVTFYDIADCGVIAQDCTVANGHTYTVPYTSDYYGGSCNWYYDTGNIEIIVTWSLGVINVRLRTETDLTPIEWCFDGTAKGIDACADIPVSDIPNTWDYCGLNEGYDGTCDIDWT